MSKPINDYNIPFNIKGNFPDNNIIVLCDKELSEILDSWMKLCNKYGSGHNLKTTIIEMNVTIYNAIRGGNYASMVYNLENPK